MKYRILSRSTELVLILVVLVVGCRQSEQADDHGHSHGDHGHSHSDDGDKHDHDHFHEHDHVTADHRPEDFADAVESLASLNQEIATELESGDIDHADHAIHEILDIARWLPEIAADSDMPEGQWNEVDAHSTTLTNLIGVIHTDVHERASSIDYTQTEQDVAKIVTSLRKIVADGAWNRGFYGESGSEVASDTSAATSAD